MHFDDIGISVKAKKYFCKNLDIFDVVHSMQNKKAFFVM
jgi:hypothetical protein